MGNFRFDRLLRGLSVLAIVIFIHEAGHATALLVMGYGIKDFSIGFGPSLLEYRVGETTLTLRPIPLGGFTEAGPEILQAPLLTRWFFDGAGVAANWALGFLCAVWAWRRHPLPPEAYILLPKRMRTGSRIATLFIASLAGVFQIPLRAFQIFMHEGLEELLNRQIPRHEDWATRLLFTGAWQRRTYSRLATKRTKMEFFVQALSVMSLTIGSLNLLPLSPLDGGRVVSDLLKSINKGAGSLYSTLSMSLFLTVMLWPMHGPIIMHLISKMRRRGT